MANGDESRWFAFAIRGFRMGEDIDWRLGSMDTGVPREVVITQLRAFLRMLEREYFDDFESSMR